MLQQNLWIRRLQNRRFSFFLVGLIVSLGMVLSAFEYRQSEPVPLPVCPIDLDLLEAEQIPVVVKRPRPKRKTEPIATTIVDAFIPRKDVSIPDTEPEPSLPDVPDLDMPTFIDEPLPDEEPVPMTRLELYPQFPGGEKALFAYLRQNLNYPQPAADASIQGKVYISFVVGKDGRITDVKVERGIGGGCDEEALRVVREMPDWKPGMQNGYAVATRFYMPVSFVLR